MKFLIHYDDAEGLPKTAVITVIGGEDVAIAAFRSKFGYECRIRSIKRKVS